MSRSLRWEYRRAEDGRSTYWARQPDDFERAVAGRDAAWPREAPEVPADLARTADLLCRLEGDERPVLLTTPTGDIYRLRARMQSEENGVVGTVVQVAIEEPDPRVTPLPEVEIEPGELAALLMWCAEGGPAVSISPEAWRALAARHPFAVRVLGRLGPRCALYDCPLDLADRLTGGSGLSTSVASRHRVALLTLDRDRELCQRDWHLYAWMEGSNAAWRAVQAVFPPIPYLERLSDGQFSADDSETVMAAIAELYGTHDDIPLGTLARIAQGLDALGLPHFLREATPEEVQPSSDVGPYGIQATERGLWWRHPPVGLIAGPDLASLALGPHRDVVPAGLLADCRRALETEPADAAEGLFWWQLGVEMDLPRLFDDVRLSDALRWAEAQPAAMGGDATRWITGLLTLGARTTRAQGPLMTVLATRLARVIRRSGVTAVTVPGTPADDRYTAPQRAARTAPYGAVPADIDRMPTASMAAAQGDRGAERGVEDGVEDDVERGVELVGETIGAPPVLQAAVAESAIIRCLQLTAARDRKQLLVELGLSIAALRPAKLSVRALRRPSDDVRLSIARSVQGAEASRG